MDCGRGLGSPVAAVGVRTRVCALKKKKADTVLTQSIGAGNGR
jgi:hypothetical protein